MRKPTLLAVLFLAIAAASAAAAPAAEAPAALPELPEEVSNEAVVGLALVDLRQVTPEQLDATLTALGIADHELMREASAAYRAWHQRMVEVGGEGFGVVMAWPEGHQEPVEPVMLVAVGGDADVDAVKAVVQGETRFADRIQARRLGQAWVEVAFAAPLPAGGEASRRELLQEAMLAAEGVPVRHLTMVPAAILPPWPPSPPPHSTASATSLPAAARATDPPARRSAARRGRARRGRELALGGDHRLVRARRRRARRADPVSAERGARAALRVPQPGAAGRQGWGVSCPSPAQTDQREHPSAGPCSAVSRTAACRAAGSRFGASGGGSCGSGHRGLRRCASAKFCRGRQVADDPGLSRC